MPAPAVRLAGITKRFGALLANDGVSLALAPGEIHAIVGENGAGKSTLLRVLYGLLAPDAGRIEVGGRAVRIPTPAAAMALGLGMVHQHFMLVDTLTVAENVTLGRESAGPLGALRPADAERAVGALAERFRLPVDPRARVASLSVGAQQRVEILKALYRGARTLLLDEPTAVLTPQEVDELGVVLRRLREEGVAIALVTHKLAEVMALADRVTILRGGRVVGEGAIGEWSADGIAERMVGRVLAPLGARAALVPGAVQLEVESLDVLDDRGLPAVRGVSFRVHAGEIVGIAGVEGNGQHELVETLAGLRAPARGRVRIGGSARPGASSADCRAAGLAHIPSDRLRRGLVPPMTLAENLVLGLQHDHDVGDGPWLGGRALDERAREPLRLFDVRPAEPRARVAQLSGGNQQKLIAARELGPRTHAPIAIVAAHPTRGVDLGAIDFLHRRLLAARDAGRAILLVSSELSEILSLSDRVLVMLAGRIVHETTPAETDERTLGLHMTGRAGAAS